MAVAVEHGGGRFRAPAGQPRIAVGGVAHQRQVVGDGRGRHAELGAHAVRVQRRALAPVEQDHAVPDDALGQVLVGRGDDDALGLAGEARRAGGDAVVGLELPHAPDGHAQRLQRVLGQRELREQLGGHARVRLVARVQLVAEGADDGVAGGGHGQRLAFPQERQRARREARHGAHLHALRRRARGRAEVGAEELVGGVEEDEPHGAARYRW